MKHITVLISLTFSCLTLYSYAQKVSIPKDTLYLNFTTSFDKCELFENKDKLKWKKKEGIQFNLCGKAILLFPKKGEVDTLDINYLKKYPISSIEQIDSLVKSWQDKTKPLLIKKYGIPYPNTMNKNNMFVTYLIEKHEDYFIKYRVYWRNQRI